jgi:hypothetical protein
MANKKKQDPIKRAARLLEASVAILDENSRKEMESVLNFARTATGEAKRLKAEAAVMRKEAEREASALGKLLKRVKKELAEKKKTAKRAAKVSARSGGAFVGPDSGTGPRDTKAVPRPRKPSVKARETVDPTQSPGSTT